MQQNFSIFQISTVENMQILRLNTYTFKWLSKTSDSSLVCFCCVFMQFIFTCYSHKHCLNNQIKITLSHKCLFCKLLFALKIHQGRKKKFLHVRYVNLIENQWWNCLIKFCLSHNLWKILSGNCFCCLLKTFVLFFYFCCIFCNLLMTHSIKSSIVIAINYWCNTVINHKNCRSHSNDERKTFFNELEFMLRFYF